MKKIFRYAFLALLGITALTLGSCTESYEYDATPAASGSQVYFSNELPSQVEISPDATSFAVAISRVDSTDAITVPLQSTITAGSIFSVPSQVSFAAGQRTVDIPVSYDPASIEYGRYDTISIAINDASYTTVYGNTATTVIAGVTDWGPWEKWNSAGTATYTYVNLWSGDNPGLPFVYRHNTIHTNLYQFKLSNWGSGVDLVLDYDTETGHVTCAPQFAYAHATYGDVLVADSYYYWFNVRGTDISKMSEEDYGHFDEENGIITIPLAYYVSAGTFGYDNETVTIDGYLRADVSCDVAYVGKLNAVDGTTYVLADVTLGADVTKANVALIEGDLSQESLNAVIDGSAETLQEVTTSGQVKFAADSLADGSYTFVVVSFLDEEAQNYAEASFKYFASPDAKETWTPVYVGTYVYGAQSLTQDGGLFYDEVITDEGVTLYVSDLDDSRYKIAPWANLEGEEGLEFTLNEDNSIVVDHVFTGHTHPTYGDIVATDVLTYGAGNITSYYENGVFNFFLAYHVDAGAFAYVLDTFTLTGQAARALKAHQAAKKTFKGKVNNSQLKPELRQLQQTGKKSLISIR
ncbi:MAG: hypothetical protein IJ841_11730 [Prevotella sp.]|nr:hypothetical protein [Prevotella sp.]